MLPLTGRKIRRVIRVSRRQYECARVLLPGAFLPLLLSARINLSRVQPSTCRKTSGPPTTSSLSLAAPRSRAPAPGLEVRPVNDGP